MAVRKPSKQELVTSIGIFIWILLVNIAAPLITSVPPWPMFFVTIFFFTLGGDPKNISMIFASGFVGLFSTFVLFKLLGVFAPTFGELPTTLVILTFILGLIIIGGCYFPICLNNITFAYLTIATINPEIIESHFVGWTLMFLIGGAIILGGALVIAVTIGKKFETAEAVTENNAN